MSYDLRTPLHVIMGYTDLLIEGAFGYLNRDQLDTLRRMDQGARELLAVINGVIDLRALDASRAPLELRQGQLPDLVRGCCQLIVEVLGCDVGQAWVWQPATDVYVPVASHGALRQHAAPPRETRLPRTRVVSLLAAAAASAGVGGRRRRAVRAAAELRARSQPVPAGAAAAQRRGAGPRRRRRAEQRPGLRRGAGAGGAGHRRPRRTGARERAAGGGAVADERLKSS